MADLNEFYENVDVTFEGKKAEGYKELLSGLLDDIVQRLPDDDLFKTPGHIYFSTLEKIIERWEDPKNPHRVRPQYLESIKHADKQWKNLADILRDTQSVLDAFREMSLYADGCSTPIFRNEDGYLVMEYIVDIVVDNRMMFRSDDYIKGTICHEIVEFTTKGIVFNEHKDEIKKIEDINKIFKKYLKSGSYPPSKEYDEHEEIVNREVKRLGFEKEIAVIEKGEITDDNIRSM